MPDCARFGVFEARAWVEHMIQPLARGGAVLDLAAAGASRSPAS